MRPSGHEQRRHNGVDLGSGASPWWVLLIPVGLAALVLVLWLVT